MDLKCLLKPKSVALIGATDKLGFGKDTCENLIKSSLGDRAYFISPKREELMGKKCYKSLAELPEVVDLVIISTPKSTVKGILEEAGELGCKAAMIYASGYSEVDKEGAQAESELMEVARKYDMAVCGPNCAGFMNTIDNIMGFGLPLYSTPKKGNIGLFAQSGQVCFQLMNTGSIDFSYVISSGNSKMVDTVDYFEFLVDDPDTKVVAVYLEGVRQPDKFVSVLAKAAKIRKPVIVLKTGASSKGQQITTAHTGSLAGSDEAFNAIFKKFGVIRVSDMEELLNTSNLFSMLKSLPEKASFAVMNLSGAETGISADLGQIKGIDIPDFEPETLAKLKKLLPDYATPNNPLDMTATLAYDKVAYPEAIRTVMADPNIGMVILGLNIPQFITDNNRDVQFGLCEGIAQVAREETSKPAAVMCYLNGTRAEELRQCYAEANVPILSCPQYALDSLNHLEEFINYRPEKITMETAVYSGSCCENTRKVLSEHESKLILGGYGIPVTKEYVVKSEDELLSTVKEVGYPVVLKIDSPDIPHKTDAGAVRVNIMNEDDVLEAYREIYDNVAKFKPDARINGMLVQEMLPKGLEVIVGVTRDEQFGPMVLVGLGGIYVEIFKDFALYPAPLNRFEARQMIESLKVAPLFKGYRGTDKLDVDALANVIVSIGQLAADKKNEIRELDINPLFVYPEGKGVRVADGLIVVDSIQ